MRPTRKTGKKTGTPPRAAAGARTVRSPRNGAEMPTGAHEKNTGGRKGRSRRKADAFRAFAVSHAADPAFQDRLKAAALAGDMQAVKLVVQYAEGLPLQPIEHTGKDGGPVSVLGLDLDDMTTEELFAEAE